MARVGFRVRSRVMVRVKVMFRVDWFLGFGLFRGFAENSLKVFSALSFGISDCF